MDIYEAFKIDLERENVITFIGSGGKTTTMFKLAEELKRLNKRVLVTTTTAIFCPDKGQYDSLIISEEIKNIDKSEKGTVTVIGRTISKENKLLGINKELIDEIYFKKPFDFILVEADGSRGRSIKAPALYEPVIPLSSTITVGIIGLDILGKKINAKNVHRPELFCSVTGSKKGKIVNEEKITRLIENKNGLFKDTPEGCKKILLLNKAEGKHRKASALAIKDILSKNNIKIDGIIIGSIKNKSFFME
ncbi:selenium cofactor biosynthesis protein YqeC [Thermohalobacter berrensis]|uniref:Hydroxylase n=1 Tax=Thermohalobacter berrensis TaxID=99594 RepID=A0A419T684_9FIRM|nr:selenium cofactor biosynthesis protein YqeC [Thermohalobacter berrensis]RKD32942.1 hypothetical protein BET03_10015 [Thermohalobacter berrensis]